MSGMKIWKGFTEMKVLFIGKYPPIQGGTASAAYWRILNLKKYNINFDIITAIVQNNEYYINEYKPENNVYIITEKMPWHIPYSQLYAEQLISKALELSEINDYDVIEGSYLFPYGFAAYVVSKILNKPLILRHAGSDLQRISESKNISRILSEMISSARCVVTYDDCVKKWSKIYDIENLYITSRYIPDPYIFRKSKLIGNNTVFLGKITPKWENEQFDYWYDYIVNHTSERKIHVYSNQYTIEEFKKYFVSKGIEIIENEFVTPQTVPKILDESKYVLVSQIPSGISEESNIYKEARIMGCTIVCRNTGMMITETDFNEYLSEQIEIYNGVLRNEKV